MNRLPAATGMLWLKQGFALFRKQPGLLTMLLFANMLFTLLLSAIPVLGGILSMVLIPAFSMVIFQACRQLEANERVTPAVLLTGFQQGKAGPLAKLGLVYFVLAIALSLIVAPWIDVTAIQEAAKAARANQPPTLPSSTVSAIFGFVALMAAMIIALSFAPALTHWRSMPTFKSIFYSVFAVVGSIGPMLVMLGMWFGVYVLVLSAVMLLLGSTQFVFVVLMWMYLIFTVILQCSLYAAYRHLIPDTD